MNPVIERIYETGCVEDRAGHRQPNRASPIQYEVGQLLYHFVRERNLQRTLEVGLAYGLSAMFICQAHQDKGSGAHLAIDPNQEAEYQSIGLLNIERAGLVRHCSFDDRPSFSVLPQLLSEAKQIDFAFIDGCHTFDFALLDFFYVDRMLEVGGYVAFDDLWMPGVRKVIAYVLRNRAYRLVPLSGPRHSSVLRRVARVGRRFVQDPLGRDVAIKRVPVNVCALEKLADDTRAWDFHRPF